MTGDGGKLLGQVVRFGRVLRRVGLSATPAQADDLSRALASVGVEQRSIVKAAARAIYVCRREQIEPFDRAFEAFWRTPVEPTVALGRMKAPVRRPREVVGAVPVPGLAPGDDLEHLEIEVEQPIETWSAVELLAHKEFGAMTPAELERVRALVGRRAFRLRPRRSRRLRPARRGPSLDLRRTLRHALRYGGEPVVLARRARGTKPRPLVVLCDVSGSMALYARILLHFLWAAGRTAERFEAFVFATRLTRVTRQLAERDVEQALRRAGDAVADLGGGTRIGAALTCFNREWGRRVLGRGAVVLVISDGWDRGEPELVASAMKRLAGNAHRLVWLNPHLGDPRYEPLTRGMRAALPFVDDFLPVHNLQSLDDLAAHLGRLEGVPGSRSDGRRHA